MESDLFFPITEKGVWKGKTYNQDYSTQQGSHSDSREIKTFTDKQKLREFNTTKPVLQQMLKELL